MSLELLLTLLGQWPTVSTQMMAFVYLTCTCVLAQLNPQHASVSNFQHKCILDIGGGACKETRTVWQKLITGSVGTIFVEMSRSHWCVLFE